jgi:hypothetical protein
MGQWMDTKNTSAGFIGFLATAGSDYKGVQGVTKGLRKKLHMAEVGEHQEGISLCLHGDCFLYFD